MCIYHTYVKLVFLELVNIVRIIIFPDMAKFYRAII